MKNISLVRYRHRNPVLPPAAHLDEFPFEEKPFYLFECKKIANYTSNAFSRHFEKFSSRV